MKAYLSSPVTKSPPFPPSSLFPAAGRATPDVSALGEGFQTIMNGKVFVQGGTSASTPTFASIVSLLNEARLQVTPLTKSVGPLPFPPPIRGSFCTAYLLQPNLFYRPTQAGKKQLGFLNPWLYANPDVLTDITTGTNAISRTSLPLKYGYNCTRGWDPATGLGTPVFSKLLAAALSLP